MGSHMKRAIFDDQTSKALMSWHKKVRKNNKDRSHHHSQRSTTSNEDSVGHDGASSDLEGSVGHHHHLTAGALDSSIDSWTTPRETPERITKVDHIIRTSN